MEFYIERIKDYSAGLTEAVNKLLVQLNEAANPLTDSDVKDMIASSVNKLFVARKLNDKEMIGMLTLIVFRIPVAKRGLLEDLVVDRKYRGKGIATKLISTAINEARRNGASYLYFSSNPKRVAANRLYRHLGFKKRETNLYRVEL